MDLTESILIVLPVSGRYRVFLFCLFSKKKKNVYLAVLGLSSGTRDLQCYILDLVPRPGWNLCPLHWEQGVFTSGP